MEIVLLACSNRKEKGGVPEYAHSVQLKQHLAPDSYQRLINIRAELVRSAMPEKSLPIGPDTGYPSTQKDAKYLPAYIRYKGIVYMRGRVEELYPQQTQVRLVIISALYGLLDGEDLIQDYDLRIDEKVGGRRLYTWWNHHRLGSVVEEYIRSCKPEIVHDLLPISYQKALQPWPRDNFRHIWKPLDCSGLGQGASWRRGDYLSNLLLKK